MRGTVKFFNNDRGFGFISPTEGGDDAFVHISALQASGITTLTEGQEVNYEVGPDRRGRQSATNVELV